jgi:hypothetical protein
VNAVRFAEPRSTPAQELNRLVDEQAALRRRLRELDDEQRAASETRESLSAGLAALERRAAAGEKVSAAERAKLEAELAEAKARMAEPWAERRAGVEAAIRDSDHGLRRHVADNLDALIGELAEDATAAAGEVDAACRDLVTAYQHRQAVDGQTAALLALVRSARPGDVERTRAEQVVNQATRLLQQGGEMPPLVRVDPRAPRPGEVVDDGEPVRAA